MYTITVENYTGEYTIHNPFDETLKVVDPVLALELNKSGTLTFSISPDNVNRMQIQPMASEINVYRDGVLYWVGRPIQVEENFDMMHEVTCEGILGYLLDTQVPPFDFTGNNSITGPGCLRTFLTRLLNRHNASLSSSWEDQRKKLYVGEVTVFDSNQNLARSAEDFNNTLETINEKLLETHGGYLRVRYGDTRYVDYIETFGAATQPIAFGENLLDLTAHVNTEEVATTIIPQGAQVGNDNKRVTLDNYTPTTTVRNRISELTHGGGIRTISASSSFDGWRGIYDAAGENNYGRVYVTQTWDDVTLQENLALKAAQYIGAISVLGKTIDLSAVDLAQIDVDFNSFNIGEMATVVSVPHGINAEYQITQMNIDLFNPANSTLVLGGEMRTFTFDNTKKVAEMVGEVQTEISDAVANATALLSGGLGGYLIIRQDETGQPYEILIMNAATETAATRCVRINRNGIGFGQSSSGSTSWTYRNAWTIDGNLVADFITTGTLNASLIKAGVLQDQAGNTTLNMTNGTLAIKKGSINLGGGNFTVNDSGRMTATDVNIGGFKLTNAVDGNYALHQDYGIYRTWIRGATRTDSGNTWAFSTQKKVNGSYQDTFKVTSEGEMRCHPARGNTMFTVARSDINAFASNGVFIRGEAQVNMHVVNGGSFHIGRSYASMEDRDGNTNISIASAGGMQINPGRSTTGHSGNLYVDGNERVYMANEGSSSRKIKHDIKPVENDELNPERLYDAEVVQFKYNDDFLDEDDPNRGKDLIGFIVEDLREVYPAAVSDDTEDSKDWTWSTIRMVPAMLKLIQDQKKQIDDLTSRIEEIERRLNNG